MKKSWLLVLISAFAMDYLSQMEAAIVRIGGPESVMKNRQAVRVVMDDNNGNISEQTLYYDSAIGGLDLNTTWASPHANLYFPDLGTSYLWYNGYWVDQEGYYWDGGRRVYVNHSDWNSYWSHHWHGHEYGKDGHWHDKIYDNEHRDNEQRDNHLNSKQHDSWNRNEHVEEHGGENFDEKRHEGGFDHARAKSSMRTRDGENKHLSGKVENNPPSNGRHSGEHEREH